MSSPYKCLLLRDSKISLSMLHLQQNSNATSDLDAMTSEDVNSFPRSFILDPHNTQVPLHLGSARGSSTCAITSSKNGDISNSKHVGFATTSNVAQDQPNRSRPNNSQLQQQHPRKASSSQSGTNSGTVSTLTRSRDVSASGRSCNTRRSHSRDIRTANNRVSHDRSSTFTSLLVPLNSRQSNINNLHMPINRSESNAQPLSQQMGSQSQDAVVSKDPTSGATPGGGSHGGSGCQGSGDKKAGGGRDLLSVPGIPYWNVYEYQDFRQLQHGQPHVFDPLTDANLHREGLILDSYNRLKIAFPYFRRPNPVYHVR